MLGKKHWDDYDITYDNRNIRAFPDQLNFLERTCD